MTDLLMLVNADHPLPPDWEPDGLVDLWAQQPRHFLLPMRREYLVGAAFEAANAMFAEAEEAGFHDFEVRSAYRDAERQAGIFEVGTWHGPFLSDENAAHRNWIAEHCWEHGFIVRYPEGREGATGVPAEPWHLRYVGRDAALEIRDRGWVLEDWHAHKES